MQPKAQPRNDNLAESHRPNIKAENNIDRNQVLLKVEQTQKSNEPDHKKQSWLTWCTIVAIQITIQRSR